MNINQPRWRNRNADQDTLNDPPKQYKQGARVVCLRPSPNLGGGGIPGQEYTVTGIYPKVRVTPGTGAWFLAALDQVGNRVNFNLADVKRRKR